MTTGVLAFLRPLYDIAVWQFIVMSEFQKNEQGNFPQMTIRMHEVVANFMCKLMEVKAFRHLQNELDKENIRRATGNWKIGEKASIKLVEWCQDQWRRKQPVIPQDEDFRNGQPLCVTLFGNEMPLCHACGCPCPECRDELLEEIPAELATTRAIVDYEEIHTDTDKE